MATETAFQPMGSRILTRKELERIADVEPRLTRSLYFDNRLLTAEDLNRDQIYLDGRLREVGRALGSGIVQGLELTLDRMSGELQLQPGTAVSGAGRVLELNKPLRINLADLGGITTLNRGRHRRFNRGLYAVVLQYAELETDATEIFPTNPGAERRPRYDVVSEGVQLALVPLDRMPARENPLSTRADLMRLLLGDSTAGGAVPEDGVPLGVLAMAGDRPQWLDAELLRHPLRTQSLPGAVQHDLHRLYQALFRDIMAERADAGLDGDFAAVDYFSILPPVGSLPKESIDPVNGRQGYFPENFQVWTAPVRLAELDLIREEAMLLQPIDLLLQDPVDIIVPAPLSNAAYGRYAPRLERSLNKQARRLPFLDPLRLSLRPQQPVHALDTDAATWQAIWHEVRREDLLFIRRPIRPAETGISGIVLARGIDVPPETTTEPPSPADNNLLEDEESVLLNRVNLPRLADLRPPRGEEGEAALEALIEEFGNDAGTVLQCVDCTLRIERRYDEMLWQTLLILARGEILPEFLEQLREGQETEISTGAVVADIGTAYNLTPELIEAWTDAAPR